MASDDDFRQQLAQLSARVASLESRRWPLSKQRYGPARRLRALAAAANSTESRPSTSQASGRTRFFGSNFT